MKPDPLKKPYYPALDGLRGIAILLVVFLHNFGFMNYFFFGWLGVDLFFVLSGFLITDILLSSVGKPDFLKNFYMRRVLRIFPLYYLALILCLWILPMFGKLHLQVEYYQSHQGWFWAYLQNWLFVFQQPNGDKILLHTWSLAVEEQFYIFWPLLILLIKKPKILLWVVFALLLAVGATRFIIWSYHIKDLAYGSLYTFTRIDGLCIGCMLAIVLRVYPDFLKKYTTHIVLLMAAVNFGFYFLDGRHSFSLPYLAIAGYTTFAVLFGLLVYEGISSKSKLIKVLLDNGPLKFFGKISYGLYVFHWPVYILFFDYFRNILSNDLNQGIRLANTFSAISVTILAIIISMISYRYFEMPFLKLKKKFG